MSNTIYKSRFLEIDPGKQIFRVNRDAYRCPDVFELEKKKVLYKTWIVLGHESEIKNNGDYITRRVIDKNLIFNRDRNGSVNVYYNTCMHRGASVCEAKKGNTKSFVCPYHGWVYKDTGELASTGSREADASYPPSYTQGTIRLKSVKNVASRGGFYFINFDENPVSLDDYLEDAGDRLDMINQHSAAGMEVIRGCHEYEIDANYKLLCENSYDSYHLMATHASYLDYVIDLLKDTDMNYDSFGTGKSLGNGHACFETHIKAGRPIAQWLPNWGEEAKKLIEEKKAEVIARLGEQRGKQLCDSHRNMVVFPNSVINDQQSILVRSIVPLSYNKMLVRAWTVAPVDEHPVLRKIRLDNILSFLGPAGFATPDDVTMLKRCQIAYESTDVDWNDFSKGFRPEENTLNDVDDLDNELQMRAYWKKWDQMMCA